MDLVISQSLGSIMTRKNFFVIFVFFSWQEQHTDVSLFENMMKVGLLFFLGKDLKSLSKDAVDIS